MNGDFCVRLVNGESEVVKSFPSDFSRKFWLCNNGFYMLSGVWEHMDGRKAGLFLASDKKSYETCLNKITSRGSMWDGILRGNNAARRFG